MKKNTGLALSYRFGGATGGVGDHGAAAGHGFDGGDAKVFELGVNESSGMTKQIGFGVVADAAEEGDVGFGHSLEAGEFGAGAENFQGKFKPVEYLDDQVEAFVGHEAATGDKVAGDLS